MQLVGYADPDPGASLVMGHHFPEVVNYGDITTVDWSLVNAAQSVDMVSAGYPCQPFALAGQRKGASDERHLFPYVAEAVRVLRPRFVYLENVPGHRSKGFGEVLTTLSAIGYRVLWTSVRASDVGAPHKRERVFILAVDTAAPDCESFSIGSGLRSCQPTPFRWGRPDNRAMETASPWWGEFAPAIERWQRATGSLAPTPMQVGPRGGMQVAPTFSEWYMGLPPGWISAVPGITPAVALKLSGNSVIPQQGAHALRILLGAHTTE